MRSLDPRVRVVWLVGVAFTALLLGGGTALLDRFVVDLPGSTGPAVFAAIFVLGAIHTELRYRIWGFEVEEDSLYIRRGVITRVRTVVPFVRLQHVDTQRGPIERTLGLSSVVVYTAGSRQADVSIPGLTVDEADDLQERLRELAIESEHEDAL